MTLRMWVSSIAVVCLIVVAVAAGKGAIQERSEHSRPAIHLTDKMVVVTDKGKLFHRAGCKYIHGAPKTVLAEAAERDGFTPCTRCFHDALVN
jgi:hypothetical protein